MAADPRDEVLGPFDARLETCAVASAFAVYSRPSASQRLKRRRVHGMSRTYSSRKAVASVSMSSQCSLNYNLPPALK